MATQAVKEIARICKITVLEAKALCLDVQGLCPQAPSFDCIAKAVQQLQSSRYTIKDVADISSQLHAAYLPSRVENRLYYKRGQESISAMLLRNKRESERREEYDKAKKALEFLMNNSAEKKIVRCPHCEQEMEKCILKSHIYICHDIDYRREQEAISLSRFIFGKEIALTKLSWIILENDVEYSFKRIREFLKEIVSKHKHIRYEIGRLDMIFGLKPSNIYVGLNDFDGYIIFVFNKLDKAILECPMSGNATYIIRGEWLPLSKLSKSDLIHKYKGQAIRIIHRSNWFDNLKDSLYYQ